VMFWLAEVRLGWNWRRDLPCAATLLLHSASGAYVAWQYMQ
jgi:hypothetical protein